MCLKKSEHISEAVTNSVYFRDMRSCPEMSEQFYRSFISFFFLEIARENGREALSGLWKMRRANEEVPDMQRTIWNQMVSQRPASTFVPSRKKMSSQ
jgi:hypothetical protein